jgi:uncharacterized protein
MSQSPAILLVPGLNNSGPTHWQTEWEQFLPNARRVHLGSWSHPNRSSWITNLGMAIRQVTGPKIIVAHSLGCHAVANWAAQEPDAADQQIVGALLVAPPDVDVIATGSPLASFKPAPRKFLPFPSVLVASENDPYCSPQHARKLARFWRARFTNAGYFGHINAESGIGSWPYGLYLLDTLKSALSSVVTPGLAEKIEHFREKRTRRDQLAI